MCCRWWARQRRLGHGVGLGERVGQTLAVNHVGVMLPALSPPRVLAEKPLRRAAPGFSPNGGGEGGNTRRTSTSRTGQLPRSQTYKRLPTDIRGCGTGTQCRRWLPPPPGGPSGTPQLGPKSLRTPHDGAALFIPILQLIFAPTSLVVVVIPKTNQLCANYEVQQPKLLHHHEIMSYECCKQMD